MKITLKHEVQVIDHIIWVKVTANCFLLDGSIEVEDFEWDDYLYTHTENLAIEEQTESKYFINKYIDAYHQLNF